MRAAVYLRVSTGRQDEANQEPECLRLCEARGWDAVVVREQESGSKRRPGWDRVKGLVHRGEVGRVVVWALDRAGRDRVQLAQDWREILAKGGKLVSVREPWTEQDGPMQALLVEVVAYFAEAERVRIVERIRAGQERAREQGKHLGRRWLPKVVVARMREQFDGDVSSFLAAKALSLPESTVRTYYKRFRLGRFRAEG